MGVFFFVFFFFGKENPPPGFPRSRVFISNSCETVGLGFQDAMRADMMRPRQDVKQVKCLGKLQAGSFPRLHRMNLGNVKLPKET